MGPATNAIVALFSILMIILLTLTLIDSPHEVSNNPLAAAAEAARIQQYGSAGLNYPGSVVPTAAPVPTTPAVPVNFVERIRFVTMPVLDTGDECGLRIASYDVVVALPNDLTQGKTVSIENIAVEQRMGSTCTAGDVVAGETTTVGTHTGLSEADFGSLPHLALALCTDFSSGGEGMFPVYDAAGVELAQVQIKIEDLRFRWSGTGDDESTLAVELSAAVATSFAMSPTEPLMSISAGNGMISKAISCGDGRLEYIPNVIFASPVLDVGASTACAYMATNLTLQHYDSNLEYGDATSQQRTPTLRMLSFGLALNTNTPCAPAPGTTRVTLSTRELFYPFDKIRSGFEYVASLNEVENHPYYVRANDGSLTPYVVYVSVLSVNISRSALSDMLTTGEMVVEITTPDVRPTGDLLVNTAYPAPDTNFAVKNTLRLLFSINLLPGLATIEAAPLATLEGNALAIAPDVDDDCAIRARSIPMSHAGPVQIPHTQAYPDAEVSFAISSISSSVFKTGGGCAGSTFVSVSGMGITKYTNVDGPLSDFLGVNPTPGFRGVCQTNTPTNVQVLYTGSGGAELDTVTTFNKLAVVWTNTTDAIVMDSSLQTTNAIGQPANVIISKTNSVTMPTYSVVQGTSSNSISLDCALHPIRNNVHMESYWSSTVYDRQCDPYPTSLEVSTNREFIEMPRVTGVQVASTMSVFGVSVDALDDFSANSYSATRENCRDAVGGSATTLFNNNQPSTRLMGSSTFSHIRPDPPSALYPPANHINVCTLTAPVTMPIDSPPALTIDGVLYDRATGSIELKAFRVQWSNRIDAAYTAEVTVTLNTATTSDSQTIGRPETLQFVPLFHNTSVPFAVNCFLEELLP